MSKRITQIVSKDVYWAGPFQLIKCPHCEQERSYFVLQEQRDAYYTCANFQCNKNFWIDSTTQFVITSKIEK